MARDATQLMPGIYICALILYLQCMSLEGNREIHLCEKDSKNISCDNNSVVFIEDVKIRPLPYNTVMMKDNNSLEEEMKLTIQGICNDTYHCYLNDSFADLTYSIPQLPRLLNVTYKCDYEYVGCFVDKKVRLLDGTNVMKNRSMSASICNSLCNNDRHQFPYFGTENTNECFCGDGRNLYHVDYKRKPNVDCNATCANNEQEKCGRHGLISIYTTTTTKREIKSVKISEIQSKTCNFSSPIKDVHLVSIQKTAECDSSSVKDYRHRLNDVCEEETYCFAEPIPIEPSILHYLQFRTKYVMVNFSCRVPEITINMKIEEDNSGFTGIVIGGIGGLGLLAFVAVVILCIVLKRRRGTKEIEKNNGTPKVKAHYNHTRRNESENTDDNLSVEYANVQGQENVYLNTGFETKSSSNSTSKYSENKHNISSVNVHGNKREDKISRDSTTSDHYAVHPEGVYDVSNKPQYRNKDDTNQAIYSHAVDDIYDTTNTPHILRQEETYDHYHGQTSDNV